MNRSIRYLLFANIFFVVWMYFGEHFSYAATETKSTVSEGLTDLFNIFISVLNLLVTPLIGLAGWLLSPDWTYGDIGGLRPMLYKFWVTAANFSYFLYAIILIGAALANIFSFGKDNPYLIKKMLPKIALGILVTPFTWFIVSAVLSFVNIMTVAVINLPYDTIKGSSMTEAKTAIDKIEVNKAYLLDLTTGSQGGAATDASADKKPAAGKMPTLVIDPESTGPESTVKVSKLVEGSPFGIISAYAYGIFKIHKYKEIGITNISSITDIFSLGIKGLFSLIFYVMFALVLIALCAVLLVRAIRMWFFIALSPVLIFLEVIGQSKSGDSKHFTVSDFLTAAFIPVWVGAVLSIGLVVVSMVMAGGGTAGTGATGTDCADMTVLPIYGKGCIGYKIDGSVEKSVFSFGEIKVTIKGNYNNKDTSSTAGSIMQDIVGGIIALFMLWGGVMAALKSSKFTQNIVSPFESFGKQMAGSFKYAPLPIPGGSLHGGDKLLKGIGALPEQAANDRFKKSSAGQWLEKAGGQGTQDMTRSREIANMQNITNDTLMESNDIAKRQFAQNGMNARMMEEYGKNMLKTLGNSTERNKIVTEMEQKTGISSTDINKRIAEAQAGKITDDEISRKIIAAQGTMNVRGEITANRAQIENLAKDTASGNEWKKFAPTAATTPPAGGVAGGKTYDKEQGSANIAGVAVNVGSFSVKDSKMVDDIAKAVNTAINTRKEEFKDKKTSLDEIKKLIREIGVAEQNIDTFSNQLYGKIDSTLKK